MHRYTGSFSLHHLHSLPLSSLFPPLPSTTFSTVFSAVFSLSSHLQLLFSLSPSPRSSPPICPYFRLHSSIPFSPSPTPTQLPPSSVILISWPFKGNHSSRVPAQCFPEHVCFIQATLRHDPESYFLFQWREAALWTGRQCLTEA